MFCGQANKNNNKKKIQTVISSHNNVEKTMKTGKFNLHTGCTNLYICNVNLLKNDTNATLRGGGDRIKALGRMWWG